MTRRQALVPALVLAALVVPAAARAQVGFGERRLVRYTMRGVEHELVLPAGWDGQGQGDGFSFSPPANKITQPPFAMAVVLVEKQKGFTAGSQDVAEWLANDDKSKSHPGWSTTKPDSMGFVGYPGAIIMLGGNDDSGVPRAIMYVVAVTATEIYYLRAEGSLNDSKTLAEDLLNIINGVRRLDGADQAAPRRDPADNPTIDDPAWGLAVTGLGGAWDLRAETDAYVLMAVGRPEAEVRIARVAYKARAAYEKQARRRGRAAAGFFAGRKALIVDRNLKSGGLSRTYYLLDKTSALAIEVQAGDLEAALAQRVPQVESAFSLGPSSVSAGRAGGVSAQMHGGVAIATTRKWKLGGMGAGRLSFVGPRGVMVEVKVFDKGRGDPWEEVPATATQQCKLAGGKMEVSEIAVLGAQKAFRFRCQAKDAAALLTLAEGSAGGAPVFVRTVSQYQRATAELPDAEAAEFLTFLRVGK